MAKHQANRRLAGQLCRLCPVLLDLGHVDVGNKIVGVGALKYERLDGVISLGSLNQGNKIANQSGPSRFIGGAAMSANRTPPSLRTLSVSKTIEISCIR